MAAYKDITNQRFGRLTAIRPVGKRRTMYIWLCRCDCGGSNECSIGDLTSGNTRSCGCLNSEVAAQRKLKHGASARMRGATRPSPEYTAYNNAKQRCNNPKLHNYYAYGGRGIKFNFESFKQFLLAVGTKPSRRHSLDRINAEGNYEPGNVRWATTIEQRHNRSASAKC